MWPGHKETRSVTWTNTLCTAVNCPFLYCGVSEGSGVAFKPVLVAWVLQILEYDNTVREEKPQATTGQSLGKLSFLRASL